jgi:hypothetical protein
MADDSFPFDDAPEAGKSAPASPSASATCTPAGPGRGTGRALRERLARIECRRRCARPCGKRSGSPARGAPPPAAVHRPADARRRSGADPRGAGRPQRRLGRRDARQHRLERLRERLLEDESVLTEIGADHPGADLTRLRQLRRNAPCTSAKPASRRNIFANCSARELREMRR